MVARAGAEERVMAHRESTFIDGRIVRNGNHGSQESVQPTLPWRPTMVRFIQARFATSCYWSNCPIAAGASVAYYVEERRAGCLRCHAEACP